MSYTPKSKYVGNHGGAYTDRDGMSKQFTVVDHDKHTTRLRTWKGADHKPQEETPEEKLIREIKETDMNKEPLFIEFYDTILASKYGFERFKKGKIVDDLRSHNKEEKEEWYKDLQDIFNQALKAKIKQLQNYGRVQK